MRKSFGKKKSINKLSLNVSQALQDQPIAVSIWKHLRQLQASNEAVCNYTSTVQLHNHCIYFVIQKRDFYPHLTLTIKMFPRSVQYLYYDQGDQRT